MKLEFSRQIFQNYSNSTLYKNPPKGNRVVQCGQTNGKKLTVAARNFVKTQYKDDSKYISFKSMFKFTEKDR
jgi:hypothetical protein